MNKKILALIIAVIFFAMPYQVFAEGTGRKIVKKIKQEVKNTKKNVTFRGSVVSKGTNSMVILPEAQGGKRAGNKTINFASGVVFKSRKGKTITFGDIQVGHKVVVFGGVWNRQESIVYDATKVMDQSLPR